MADNNQTIKDIQAKLDDIEKTLENATEKISSKDNNIELKADINREKIEQQIKKDVFNRMEFYYHPPRFLKPAFFLDELTTFLKVTLITDMADCYNPKRRFELFDTTVLGDAVHNHLNTFTYESTPENNEQVIITLTDVEQSTVDHVVFLLSSIQNGKLDNGKLTGIIYIEVQFGWAPSKLGKKSYPDYSNDYGYLYDNGTTKEFVRFTRTIYFVPGADDGQMGIKVEYTPDGLAKMTLSGMVDQTFPDPFKSINPLSVFGPMPASNLTLYNLDRIMFYYVCRIIKADFSNKETNNVIMECYSNFVNELKFTPSLPLLNKLIINALRFYCFRCTDTGIFKNLFKIIRLLGISNDDIKITITDGYEEKINNLEKRLNTYQPEKIKDFIKNSKRFFSFYNKSTGGQSTKSNKSIFNKPFYQNDGFVSDFDIITGTDEYPGHQILLRNIFTQFKKMNIDARRDIQNSGKNGENVLKTRVKQGVLNHQDTFLIYAAAYYQSLGALAQEMKLHPYYLYAYVMKGLQKTLAENETRCDLLFLDYGALNDGVVEAQTYKDLKNEITSEGSDRIKKYSNEVDYEMWDTSNLENTKKYKGNVLPFAKKQNRLNEKWEKLEGFYFPAHEFNTGPSDNWQGYLSNICSKIFIHYDVRNDAHAEKLVGKDAVKEEKESTKKTKTGLNKIPIRLKQQMFITSTRNALENVFIQFRIVNSMILLAQKDKSMMSEKKLKNLKEYRDSLIRKKSNMISNLYNNMKYLVCIRDVVSTDAIFDADVTASNILQAYSYRSNNVYNGQFDPGFKSCWTVNFPDVLEFTPEYNNFQAAMEITKNAHYVVDTTEVEQLDAENELKNLELETDKLKDEVYKGELNIKDVATKKSTLNALKEQVKNIGRLNEITKTYGYKFQFGHYGDNFVANFGETEAQTVLRSQQTMRRRMLLSTNVFNATMRVLGDPNFDLFSRGDKFIFLKFINNDGQLGYFTGVYNIMGFSHNIESGKYVTTLKLSYYPLLDTAGINTSLEKIVNESDVLTYRAQSKK